MPPPPSTLSRARDLVMAGKYAQAEPMLRRCLQRDPTDFLANHLLSAVLMHAGDGERALYFAQRAAADARADAGVFDVLGTIHAQLARFADSRDAFRRAVTINPKQASAWNGLGTMMRELDDAEGSCEAMGKACELAPGNANYQLNHAIALSKAWRTEECLALLRREIGIHPDNADLRSLLASLLNYAGGATPEEVTRQHREAGRILSLAAAKSAARASLQHSNRAEKSGGPPTGRPVRIGFLSPDLREHSIAHFLFPLLRERSKETTFIACYFCGGKADATTKRLRALTDLWRDIFALEDEAAAAVIRGDGLDLLIDLAGHTAGTRLPVLAHKPAPVIATYLGYPNTTGLPEMDYRIVDSNTDPPGAEAMATERLVRLDPCFLCFAPPTDAPEIGPSPGRDSSQVTFGSFNAVQKLNPETMRMWGELLRAYTGSRLLLKAQWLDHPATGERVRAALARAGIEEGAYELRGMIADPKGHLSLYNSIDIALDPFPYHGTTTTCQALWMGVPVLSRAGETHASRVGVTLLRAVGLEDLIARSGEEFVAKGAALARDVASREELRRTLRGRMLASPLCDAKRFAARFEKAAREMCGWKG